MIRKLLLCGGTHGRPEAVQRLCAAARSCRPDGVLFVGGIIDPAREFASRETPWGLTRTDSRFVERFLFTLGGLGVFSVVIPSLPGIPLDEILKLGMTAELEHPTVHLAHATLIEAGGLAVTGLGTPIAEHSLCGIDYLSRAMAQYHLRALAASRQPRKVLLLPAPPPGPLGGPRGEPIIGELIDSVHPELCVVAGATDHAGFERVGRTLVVNPGYLADDCAALLDWGRPRGWEVERLQLGQEQAIPSAL